VARIRINLDGTQLDTMLARVAATVADSRSLFQYVCLIALEQMVSTAFRAQGPGWAPLSPVTLRRRRKGSSAILQDTGRLRNSIVSRGAGSLFSLQPTSMEVGSNLVYAATQQFGRPDNRFYNTPKGRPAPIPARPFLPTAEDVAHLIASRKIERFIQEQLRA